MRIVKIGGKWYVNRCGGVGIQGKEALDSEFREFCHLRQNKEGCNCPLLNDKLGTKYFGKEEDVIEIEEDVAMALLRNCR
ncbi:MAG: hypothetical protein M0P12_04575 [Paludibacteraceae bacterium]|nr:hypothetical protein [Paludibacteraceae bacterium]MCK9615801.1 hypothetical protein [Candidatus Omnitrophota bacterium]